MYENLGKNIVNEMNTCVPYSDSKKIGRNLKYISHIGAKNSQTAWDNMHNNGKVFKTWKGNRSRKTQLHKGYKCSLQKFDKILKYKEREYQRGLCIDLQSTKTNNPREFWSNLNNLGPTKRNSIPGEYCDTQGNVTHKQKNISQGWKNDFELLYNPVYEDSKFDNDFLSSILEYNTLKDAVIADPLFTPNQFLNTNFSRKEISDVIMKANNNKAVGIDKLGPT